MLSIRNRIQINKEVLGIIGQIHAGNLKSTSIDLSDKSLTDADIHELMNAIQANPDIAETIIYIDLSDNKLDSITIANTLIGLKELRVQCAELTAIIIPNTLTSLNALFLNNNKLRSIVIPGTLTALEKLVLNNNVLTSITIPKTLTGLTRLCFDNNALPSITIHETFIGLEWLCINNNQLTSIKIPSTLGRLQRLCVAKNKLTSITIPSLHNLIDLWLNDNKLFSVTILSNQTQLEDLLLENNSLSLMSQIILNRLQLLNPNINLRIDQLQDSIPNILSNQILEKHFNMLLEDMKKSYNQKSPAHNMIARIGVPADISALIFNALDENQSRIQDEVKFLKTLNTFSSEEQDIINDFEAGDSFKNLTNDYIMHVRHEKNYSVAYANHMKRCLIDYRLNRNTPKYTTNTTKPYKPGLA